MRGRFGLFGVLLIVVLALLVGGVAYNWGLAAGQTQVAAPGSVGYPVVYGHPYGFGFGFGLFGLLFFFLIFGLLISAFRGRRWGGGPGGPGGWGGGMGPRSWGPGWGGRYEAGDPTHRQWQEHDVPPTFEAWHRRAHGESGSTTPPGGTSSPGSSGSSGAGGSSDGPPTTR